MIVGAQLDILALSAGFTDAKVMLGAQLKFLALSFGTSFLHKFKILKRIYSQVKLKDLNSF